MCSIFPDRPAAAAESNDAEPAGIAALRPRELRKTTLESWISRGFLDPNLAKGILQDGMWRPIQRAIAAKRKSPACEDAAGITADG
jgi:hypothetical protein